VPDRTKSGASPQAPKPSDEPTQEQAPQGQAEQHAVSEGHPEPQPSDVPEGQYTRERLINESRILGYPGDVVAGALHGQEQNTFSIDQARQLIEANENRVITPEGE
jgi:hypothetical protein